MKNRQKGFIGIPILMYIILGVLVLVSGAYFITQQNVSSQSPISEGLAQKDIQSWKTYTNSQYGFELKYPGDWRLSGDAMSGYFYKKFNENSVDFVCSFGAVAITNPDYLKQVYPNNKRIPINFGNISAEKIEGISDGVSYGNYFIKSNKQNTSFDVSGIIEKIITNKNGEKVYSGTVNNKNCINIFGQILSTFKFTS